MFLDFVRPLLLGLIVLPWTIAMAPGASHARQTTLTEPGGNSFTSEQFGYLLEWGTPWESSGQMVQELFEGVILTDGNKMTGVMTLSAHGGQITFESAAEVLDFVVDGLVANVPDATVAVEDRNALVPWAELTYTGPQAPARSFVEVFALASAGAYMYSIVEGPNAEFEEALVQAAEAILLDGKVFVAQERAGQSPSDANSRDFQNTERPPSRGGGAAPADNTVAIASYGGGPAHTGEQPGPAPMVAPEQAWAFATGDAFAGARPAAVAIDHGLVFTSSNAVYAIDILTGEEVWSYGATMGFLGPPALVDGVLYAAGEDGSVYAFEPESGEIIWQSALTGGLPINGGPLVDGDALYVTSWDWSVKALATETGSVLWSTPIGGYTYGQPAYADGYVVLAGPGVGDAAFPGMLAIEASSGEVAWTFVTGGPVFPVPTISDGAVYFGGEEGILYAADLRTGEELWSIETAAPISAAPAVSGGVVYVVNGASELGAYDALSGNLLWTAEVGAPDLGGISVTPSEDGKTLILVGDGEGRLHAFDAAGFEVYAVEVTVAGIVFPATVVDGVIYVAAGDGTVYALAAES